jgi:hypothetical protein
VTIALVPEGVRVLWRPTLALLGRIAGIEAAMYAAMGSILEHADFQVLIRQADLLVVGLATIPQHTRLDQLPDRRTQVATS